MGKPKLSAILLAAGSSLRMGTVNKLLLPFQEQLIIQHLIQELAAAKIDELIVVLGHEDKIVKSNIPANIHTVFNEQHRSGMTSSIQTGIKATNNEHKGYMICLADQVLMQTTDYNQIINEWQTKYAQDQKCIALPFHNQQRGNPVIFSSCYKNEILAQAPGNGCKAIVQKHKAHLHKVVMKNNHVLIDVDTPTDYNNTISKKK